MASVSDSTSANYADQKRAEAYDADRARTRESYEKEIKEIKSDYNERIEQDRKEANADIRKLKEDLYDSKGKKFSQDSVDFSAKQNELDSYRNDLEKEYRRREDKLDQSTSSRVRNAETRTQEKVEDSLAAQKKSQTLELQQMQDALRQAKVDPQDAAKERAQARQQAIQEVEGSNLTEKENIIKAYEQALKRAKEQAEDLRNSTQNRISEVKYESQGRTNEQLRQQKNNFLKRDADRVVELQQVEKQLNGEIAQEKFKNARGNAVLYHNFNEQTEKALSENQKAMNSYYESKKKGYEYDIETKGKEINTLKTTDKEILASPALVNKLRYGEEKKYAKQLEAQYNHDKNQEEGLKAAYAKAQQELKDHFDHEITTVHKESTKHNDLDKSMLMTSYDDLKQSKEQQVQHLHEDFRANRERSQVKHAQDLDLLQRKNIETMNEQRDTYVDVNRKKISETEFEGKVKQREMSAKLSGVQREHEKKLGELSDMHDIQMSELRLEFDTKIREQARSSAKLLDDHVTGYEHKLKEQELTFKDKERFLTEHYESIIDKMKQTNARLIQKKS